MTFQSRGGLKRKFSPRSAQVFASPELSSPSKFFPLPPKTCLIPLHPQNGCPLDFILSPEFVAGEPKMEMAKKEGEGKEEERRKSRGVATSFSPRFVSLSLALFFLGIPCQPCSSLFFCCCVGTLVEPNEFVPNPLFNTQHHFSSSSVLLFPLFRSSRFGSSLNLVCPYSDWV